MSVPRPECARKHLDRPPTCPGCGADAWWNGWREVTRTRLGPSGRVETQPAQRLHRAICSMQGCSAAGWTVYPPGRYPCRRFDLDVVANAVASNAFARDTEDRPLALASIGGHYACSGRTIARWTHWVVELTDVESLARDCIRIDPEGMPAAARVGGIGIRGRAGYALAVFDRFADLLEKQAILPRNGQPSLVRILDDQRVRHGVRFPLRNSSPPLSLGAADTAPYGR